MCHELEQIVTPAKKEFVISQGGTKNTFTKEYMKYLKINTAGATDLETLKNAILQMKGVDSVEIIDEENPESELKKAFAKTKEQLKKGAMKH